jgi:hypothetical protein
VKLVDDFDPSQDSSYKQSSAASTELRCYQPGLKQRFVDAMIYCQHQADLIGAHYWWNVSQLLQDKDPMVSVTDNDTKILTPMFLVSKHYLEESSSIIEHCEKSFVGLKRTMERLQSMVKEMMGGLARLRNKMWYMTDVKNSLRYEDARNVALALKTMAGIQEATPSNPEPKSRHGPRSLGPSFLQKPEIQVMNVMKAHPSQGGPSKLADEQVDITRRWLQRYGIDNFCKGEERIHRFCLEVKTSVNKLVGETMSDTPVLWSSELYQREKSMYEASAGRPVSGLAGGPNLRPSSIASEDSLYHPTQHFGTRTLDHLLRPLGEAPSLVRKSSFQSLSSDRWKTGRDAVGADTSSIGDSPGRTVSASTADSSNTFWSPTHTQAQSTTSVSSFHSRPPSMFSDVLGLRRPDRHTHRKIAFLDDLRQTLTSLLLSDLGSPVWSCGSETDAWFSESLSQLRIQTQMERRARTERFLAECALGVHKGVEDQRGSAQRTRSKRSRSADSALLRRTNRGTPQQAQTPRPQTSDRSEFPYNKVFRQLMDRFSRNANPFLKLKVLCDLRALVIASLRPTNSGREQPDFAQSNAVTDSASPVNGSGQRYSLSEGSTLQKPTKEQLGTPSPLMSGSSMLSAGDFSSHSPSESQIIHALRNLIQTIQPKTLFRDLQFIASFVPSEILNKTESGTAFLQFGLAALGLKDDVCSSMVEIADKIVSQELNRRKRHSPVVYDSDSWPGEGIADAARMWIIAAREGNPVAQRELAILYLTHPDIVPCVTLPLTMPRDTFKAEMMYRRDDDSKSDPQKMCLALHWMQLSASGGDELARNRLREREVFDSIA